MVFNGLEESEEEVEVHAKDVVEEDEGPEHGSETEDERF